MKFSDYKNSQQISPNDRCQEHRVLPFIYRKKKGVSLVIAMIFIPIMMILVAAMVEPIIQSYRAAAADQKRMLAKAIAENLIEEALFITKDLPTGTNASGCLGDTATQGGTTEDCTTEIDFVYGKATGRWEVLGQPETDEEHQIANQYYVPSLGTGDVGGDYCSSANPVYDDTDGVTLKNALKNLGLSEDLLTDPADWPCNWGKLKEGESVIIPLYSHDENGNVVNPFQSGSPELELRLRAACKPNSSTDREDAYRGEICREGRYELQGDPYKGDLETGEYTTLALWEITGKDADGKSIYLAPYKDPGDQNITSYLTVRSINGYKIQAGMPYTLNNDSWTIDRNGDNNLISYYLNLLNKPTLRLMVIHSIKDIAGNKVPYLEYQFRTYAPGTGQLPVSNSAKIVKVEVMVDGGYTENIEKTIGLSKPVTGFVIQQ